MPGATKDERSVATTAQSGPERLVPIDPRFFANKDKGCELAATEQHVKDYSWK
jgi:hypothetical protein